MWSSNLSQVMSTPAEAHLQATTRIFQYFQATQGKRIVFDKTNPAKTKLVGMRDNAAEMDPKSIFKTCVRIRGIFEQRAGKEGPTVAAMTTVESELGALAEAVQEAI